MISEFYQESVSRNTEFQKTFNGWGGWAVGLYAPTIKELVNRHNATSILDYGCGKALHYSIPATFGDSKDLQLFQDYINIKSFYCYDPCVENFNKLPPASQKFDGVIVSQVLPFIPDQDIDWVIDLLMSYSNKFCLVGNLDPAKHIKSSKKELMNPAAFKEVRSISWYEDKFSRWSGSELCLEWK